MQEDLDGLRQRLSRLEAEAASRRVMASYMRLCDRLDAGTDMSELARLFTLDACWSGRGARYGAVFGTHRGRDAILRMLDRYRTPVPHFSLNVHFLASECLRADDGADRVEGSWILLQTSAFSAGGAHLAAARIDVTFSPEAGAWRIADFRTESLFGRPVSGWASDASMPVPAGHD